MSIDHDHARRIRDLTRLLAELAHELGQVGPGRRGRQR